MSELDQVKVTRAARTWLAATALASYKDAYIEDLISRGYTARTVSSYLSGIAHFAHWMAHERIDLKRVDEAIVTWFVTSHLPSCRCAARCCRTQSEVRAALVQLLTVLRSKQLIAAKIASVPPAIAAQMNEFGAYLTDVRGVQPLTRETRVKYALDFLSDQFGDTALDISMLGPNDVIGFIMRRTAGWKPGAVKSVCSALRSYFRYRATLGDPTVTLSAALPQIAQWRLAALPKGLAAVEVNTLLGAFDRNTLGGRRDYAIARCYIDLGLRTAEIVRLQLDDIDWREGVLRVRGKGRRTDALPLPATTGSAIADYLHDARVNTDNRTLFQRLHAPHDKPIVADTVRGAMRNAAKRCGLSAQLSGPHRLRHTLAIQLVHNGASVKAIADVLRHRSLDTTTIYAKVDLKALSRVAAVWPGSRS